MESKSEMNCSILLGNICLKKKDVVWKDIKEGKGKTVPGDSCPLNSSMDSVQFSSVQSLSSVRLFATA